MYVIYIAASSNTMTKETAWGASLNFEKPHVEFRKNSTTPRALVEALYWSFDQMMREGIEKPYGGLLIISNAKYIIDIINSEELKTWAENSWKKKDGTPVKNGDLISRLIPYLKVFEEHHIVPTAEYPSTPEEEKNLEYLSKLCKSRRQQG